MSETKQFDVIIIGAGLAGLTCGAFLGNTGLRVLLLEKNRRPGGYAVSYTKKGHRFDIAVQNIGGCGSQGAVTAVLAELGLLDRVRFLECQPARVYDMAAADGTDVRWIQSGSAREQIESIVAQVGADREKVETCYRTWKGIMAELMQLGLRESSAPPFGFTREFPLLARYGRTTLQQFMDELEAPAILQQFVTARHGYCMLPSDELSLVGFACTETVYCEGAWMVAGGVENLTSVLTGANEKCGGTLLCNREVTGILTENGRVAGVALADGERYTAPVVVAAAAVRPMMERIEGYPSIVPARYRKRLARMTPSGSYYIAFYSIPALSVEGLYPNMEIREKAAIDPACVAGDTYYLLVPSLVDPASAPPGRHSLCLSIPCRVGDMPDGAMRKRYRVAIEKAVSRRFPNLADKMDFLFEMGPSQLEAMTGNPHGSAYGWAQLPEQSGIKRLGIRTPVNGLYLAGHWTMPGGGIPGVITSGKICARTILTVEK